MSCIHCKRIYGHDPRCPLYVPKKTIHYCDCCGESIEVGEEYIVNDFGEYRHFNCFYGMKDLLMFLGYKIETMEFEE